MIFREHTFEQAILRNRCRIARIELSAIDTQCFRLESRLRRLEIDWPGFTPDEKRRLRMERMRIRYELELLKVDVKDFERRTKPLFNSLT